MTIYNWKQYIFDVDDEGVLNSIRIIKTLPRADDTTITQCSILATAQGGRTHASVMDGLGNIALHLDAYALIYFWTALVDEYRTTHKGRDPIDGAGHTMQTIFRGSHKETFNAALQIISGMDGRNHEERALISLAIAQHPARFQLLMEEVANARNGLLKKP